MLVDARQGVVEQTRRHAYILSILRVPHVVVAVNKMDLVDWSQERFDEIVGRRSRSSGSPDLVVIPISALQGDNVVDRSEHMPWYDGPVLLEHLETVEIASDRDLDSRRFPVQWVIRPDVRRASRLSRLRRPGRGRRLERRRRGGRPAGRPEDASRVGGDDRRAARGSDPADVRHDPARRRRRRLARRHARRPRRSAHGRAGARGARLLDERASRSSRARGSR